MEFFQYDPIIHKEHAFRIVRLFAGTGPKIQAEIIHASLDESDILEYEAVSYVWGPSELTSTIDVEGRSLRVTNNLELVLRDLRLADQDRFLWIDGICIDQNKHKEKTHQVRQMRNIYQRAERVLFHLGRSTQWTYILHESISALQTQQNLEPETPIDLVWDKVEESLARQYTTFGARIRKSVISILSAPWFRRVWIVQEVANARRALIYWGHASFQVAGFVHLVRRLEIKIDDQQASILDMMPQKRRSQSPWSHRQDLYNLLRRFKQAKATQNHDKIFALLGMCAGGKGHGTITVDYENSEYVVISDVIASISFCEKEDLSDFCRTLESVDNLFGSIDSLLQELVVHMATNTRLAGLIALLSNRRDEILITKSLVKAVVRSPSTGPAALGILLAHAPNRTMLSIGFLRQAAGRAKKNILRVITTYQSNIQQVDTVMNSGLVTRTYSGTCSDEETIQDLLNSSTLLSRHLCLAARHGHMDSAMKSLEEGADINTIGPNGLTPLGWAAANGQRDMIELLLASSAHLETGYQSPLSLAAEHGHKNIVQILLNRGADIEHPDKYGRTPLSLSASGGCRAILSLGRSEFGQKWIESSMRLRESADLLRVFESAVDSRRVAGRYQYSARTRDTDPISHPIPEVYSEIVDLLVQKGANIEARDCLRATPLWWAANYGHLSVVVKLLRQNAEARVRDVYGFVPLIWALWSGHQEVVERLFDNGITLDIKRNDDYLFWAICDGSKTQVQWLIDKGIDMKIGTKLSASLHWAIMNGNASVLKLLLDMNAPTAVHGEEPALSLAASTGHNRIVQALLDHGENIEIPNAMGSTPLMLAAGKGRCGTVQLLLNRTAKVDSRDCHGRTPLMYAADGGYPGVVEVLIKNHAKVDAKSNGQDGNQTSLWKAALKGHHSVVRLLLERGADAEICDCIGAAPLVLARRRSGQEKIVRFLLEHDVKVHTADLGGRTTLGKTYGS